MSKRRYRSIHCHSVDWEALAEEVSGQRLVLAIDVAKHDFVATLEVAPEEVLLRVKWRHPQQTPALLAGVSQLVGVATLEAVMESSGTYGDALRWQLGALGVGVHRVSCKRVHDAAEVYDGVPSLHDPKSADLIAALHWRGLSTPWSEDDEQRRGYTALMRMLQQSKERHQSELNRLEGLLSRYWPESLELLGLNSVTLHELIAAYGDPQQVGAMVEEAGALMRRISGGALREELIGQVLGSAETSLGVPCVAEERALLMWQAQAVLDTHAACRRIEQQIAQAVEQDPRLGSLGKVVGRVSVAVLYVSLGAG